MTREISSKKLKDYLYPILLSTGRSKIGSKRKFNEEKRRILRLGYLTEFDQLDKWPKEEKISKFEKYEGIDLQNDSYWIRDSDGARGIFCTPFLQFEKTSMKGFKE